MKIYIATTYRRREELRTLLSKVEALGHECTSTWIRNGEDSEADWEAAAALDVTDVRRPDAILFVGNPKDSASTGGGRWFELGLAWAEGKRCLVLLDGGHESVFTCMPEMSCFGSETDLLYALVDM